MADVEQARAKAETIGYPLMVKATAGGGGSGVRLVNSYDELDEAFERASSEASKTAGDATVFLERAIRGGRHVEVQVVADADRTVWTLGIRDCSLRRRNQKVIEESASTALGAKQEELLRSSAAELVRAAGYVNAGTVEFLDEPKERLGPEHGLGPHHRPRHPAAALPGRCRAARDRTHAHPGGRHDRIDPTTGSESSCPTSQAASE